MPFSSYRVRGMWSLHNIADDVNLSPLVQVVFAKFLHDKVIIFLFLYSILTFEMRQ